MSKPIEEMTEEELVAELEALYKQDEVSRMRRHALETRLYNHFCDTQKESVKGQKYKLLPNHNPSEMTYVQSRIKREELK